MNDDLASLSAALAAFTVQRVNIPGDPPESAVIAASEPSELSDWGICNNRESHVHIEIMTVLDGQWEFPLGKLRLRTAPGDVFLIAPRCEHLRSYPPLIGDYTQIWFWPGRHSVMAAAVIRNGGVTRKVGSMVLTEPEFCRWFYCELNALIRMPEGVHARRRRIFAAAMTLLIEKYCAACVEITVERQNGQTPAEARTQEIARICKFIDANLAARPSLKMLAAMSHYSKYHFHRIFRQSVGMTLHSYIDRARRHQVVILEASGARQKEIAAALGFATTASYWSWRRQRRDDGSDKQIIDEN